MSENEDLTASEIVVVPAHVRHYPAHQLVSWQPQGVLDDRLLDKIAEWLCLVEKTSVPFKRFIDFSRLTNVSIRTSHVFEFARKRAEQFAGVGPVPSALFSEDWVGFGIAYLYEKLMEGTLIQARAFRNRLDAAIWLELPATLLNLDDRPSTP
jgi:hypothetical protein